MTLPAISLDRELRIQERTIVSHRFQLLKDGEPRLIGLIEPLTKPILAVRAMDIDLDQVW